jgi:hypothetical protein
VQDGSSVRLIRYLPHAIVATLLVAVVPAAAVVTLQRNGLANSLLLSIALGGILSVATASGGSALWMRHRGSRDIVFADLMIWGLVRRLRVERYVADMKRLVDGGDSFTLGSDVTAEKQIEVLTALARALETRDPYTHGHSRRVARHSYMIAKAMKLPRAEAELIRTAGAVHDVGKINIPYEVLTKPGKLTDEEFAAIKEHSPKGGELVSQVGNDKLTAIVRHHHERLDGGGYPDRLRGEDIPLGARIIAVADTFDAITSTRSYRGASRHSKAIEILRKEAGTQLDADAVHAFISYYRGRRAVAWWTTLWSMPQRLLGRLGSLLGEGAGASSLAGTAAAVSAAVIAGAALSPAAIIRVEPSATEVATPRSPGRDTAHTGDVSRSVGPEGSGRRASQPKGGSDHEGSPEDRSGSDGDSSGSGSGSSGSGSSGPGGSDSGSDGSGDGGLVDDTVDTVNDTVGDTVDTVDDTIDGVVDGVTGDGGSSGSSGSGTSGSGTSGSGGSSGSSGSGTSGSGTSGSGGSSGSGGGGLLGGLIDTVDGVADGLGL